MTSYSDYNFEFLFSFSLKLNLIYYLNKEFFKLIYSIFGLKVVPFKFLLFSFKSDFFSVLN